MLLLLPDLRNVSRPEACCLSLGRVKLAERVNGVSEDDDDDDDDFIIKQEQQS